MPEEAGGSGPVVRVRRVLPATPEEVFDAWTDVESLKRWLCPGDTRVTDAEIDLRVGGRFRVVMSDERDDYENLGQYIEVERPSRLVFSWRSPGTENLTTRVTVTFRPVGEGTEMVIVHERLPGEDSAARHRKGWASIGEKLEAALAWDESRARRSDPQ